MAAALSKISWSLYPPYHASDYNDSSPTLVHSWYMMMGSMCKVPISLECTGHIRVSPDRNMSF